MFSHEFPDLSKANVTFSQTADDKSLDIKANDRPIGTFNWHDGWQIYMSSNGLGLITIPFNVIEAVLEEKGNHPEVKFPSKNFTVETFYATGDHTKDVVVNETRFGTLMWSDSGFKLLVWVPNHTYAVIPLEVLDEIAKIKAAIIAAKNKV